MICTATINDNTKYLRKKRIILGDNEIRYFSYKPIYAYFHPEYSFFSFFSLFFLLAYAFGWYCTNQREISMDTFYRGIMDNFF